MKPRPSKLVGFLAPRARTPGTEFRHAASPVVKEPSSRRTLDAAGNRTVAVEQFDDDANGAVDRQQTFTWSYDALNRLVQETYDGPGSDNDYVSKYAFDLASNRKTLSTDTGNSNPATFSADETITYAYDSNDRLQSPRALRGQGG